MAVTSVTEIKIRFMVFPQRFGGGPFSEFREGGAVSETIDPFLNPIVAISLMRTRNSAST